LLRHAASALTLCCNLDRAWAFIPSGSTWTQQGEKLSAPEELGNSDLGPSVALSGDGGTALIARRYGDNPDWFHALGDDLEPAAPSTHLRWRHVCGSPIRRRQHRAGRRERELEGFEPARQLAHELAGV